MKVIQIIALALSLAQSSYGKFIVNRGLLLPLNFFSAPIEPVQNHLSHNAHFVFCFARYHLLVLFRNKRYRLSPEARTHPIHIHCLLWRDRNPLRKLHSALSEWYVTKSISFKLFSLQIKLIRYMLAIIQQNQFLVKSYITITIDWQYSASVIFMLKVQSTCFSIPSYSISFGIL